MKSQPVHVCEVCMYVCMCTKSLAKDGGWTKAGIEQEVKMQRERERERNSDGGKVTVKRALALNASHVIC